MFIDQASRVWLHDLEKKLTTQIDKQMWMSHDDLSQFKVNWSKDSRWLTYTHDLENQHTAIALYDTKEARLSAVTSGYYDDDMPVFDPDGKYLFYRSGREFEPIYSDQDETWIYANTRRLVAVPLRKDVPSPLAPRNDEEGEKKDKNRANPRRPTL